MLFNGEQIKTNGSNGSISPFDHAVFKRNFLQIPLFFWQEGDSGSRKTHYRARQCIPPDRPAISFSFGLELGFGPPIPDGPYPRPVAFLLLLCWNSNYQLNPFHEMRVIGFGEGRISSSSSLPTFSSSSSSLFFLFLFFSMFCFFLQRHFIFFPSSREPPFVVGLFPTSNSTICFPCRYIHCLSQSNFIFLNTSTQLPVTLPTPLNCCNFCCFFAVHYAGNWKTG